METSLYFKYCSRLVEGSRSECRGIVDTLLQQGMDINTIFTDLFEKSMHLAGKSWESSEISVAGEHAATKITSYLIDYSFDRFTPLPKVNKTAVISCVDKEYHELGAKMAARIFEYYGWDVIFLGASTPVKELLKLLKNKSVDVLGLSYCLYMNLIRLYSTIEQVRLSQPNLKIIAGGQGLKKVKGNFSLKYNDIAVYDSLILLSNDLKEGKL